MPKTKDAPEGSDLSAFRIFNKQGHTGGRVAINLQTGVSIETDGKGKYFIYSNGVRHSIASDATLEELAGLPAPEDDSQTD